MALSAVAKPYAMALLDLSVSQGAVAAVRQQLEQLVALLGTSKELQVAFANPTISVDDRKKVVQALAERMSLSRTSRNFLFVLAEKGRLAGLADIAAAFGKLADEHTGVARATVVSSSVLNEGQLTRLKAKLTQLTGKTIIISNTVDPSLIGGISVEVGGKVFDTSVAMQLRKLREAILQDI